jgi:hypothetical protein
VLYNVISTLSQRVADANGLTETQARLIRDLEKKLEDDDEDDDEYDEDEVYVEQREVGLTLRGRGGRAG